MMLVEDFSRHDLDYLGRMLAHDRRIAKSVNMIRRKQFGDANAHWAKA